MKIKILILCFGLAIGFVIAQLLHIPQKLTQPLIIDETKDNISSLNVSNCAQPPLNYKLALGREAGHNDKTKPMEFSIDLNNDGTNEIIRFYNQNDPTKTLGFEDRLLPVVMRVYKHDDNCLKELYTYTADHGEVSADNELLYAEPFNNFWGDGKNTVMFISTATAYGSGHNAVIRFLVHDSMRYKVINGPKQNELSSYKLLDENVKGRLILVANGQWKMEAEGHFNPHFQQLEMWEWKDNKYIVNKLGLTRNKYTEFEIDKIILDEQKLLKAYLPVTN